MYLPLGSSTSWQLWDFGQRYLRTDPAGADGVMRCELPSVPLGELWLVDRVVVSSTSSTATRAYLYADDDTDPARIIDGTSRGNFDVCDNNSAAQLPAGTVLIVRWEGAAAGAVGTARLQWSVMRQTGA